MFAVLVSWPLKEWFTLALLLLLGALASRTPAFRQGFDGLACRFARWIRGRGLFGYTESPAAQFRLDVMRILIAGVGMWDLSGLFAAADPNVFLAHLVCHVLFVLLLLGLATPLVAWLIIILHALWLMPAVNHVLNLGSLVVHIMMFPMALVPAGRRLSLDALLMRWSGPLGEPIRRLHAFWGECSPDRHTLAMFGSLVGFAVLCLTSCLKHLEDPGWQSGLVNALLLISPIQNKDYHALFDAMYQQWPAAYVFFARVSVYGMLAWEALLVPLLLLSLPTRWLAIVWGAMFFLVSALILNLRHLALAEGVLWVFLFLPAGLRWWKMPEDVPAPAEPPALGWMTRMWATSFLVLFLVHFFAWPAIRSLPVIVSINKRVAALVGQVYWAYGLVSVSVFDTHDDNFSSLLYLKSLTNAPGCWDETDAAFFRGRVWLIYYKPGMRCLHLGHAPEGWDGLGALLTPAAASVPRIDIELHLLSGPVEEDLLAGEYVPFRRVKVCRCSFDTKTRKATKVELFQEGIDELLRHNGIKGRLTVDSVPLLMRFPLKAELQRLRDWYARLQPVLDRKGVTFEEEMDRFAAFTDAKGALCIDPMGALNEVMKWERRLKLDWAWTGETPSSGDCSADLELARQYYHKVFDEKLREQTREHLARAEEAGRNGDVAGCLRHSGAIRRVFIEQFFPDSGSGGPFPGRSTLAGGKRGEEGKPGRN